VRGFFGGRKLKSYFYGLLKNKMMEDKKCKCNGNCKCKIAVNASPDMEAWLDDLESREQPKACTVDNPDCGNCGS
jgi:hypothetical protein